MQIMQHIVRQCPRRLPYDLQVEHEPTLQHLVLLKGAPVAITVSLDGGDRFQDVSQPFLGSSHSDIAFQSYAISFKITFSLWGVSQ